MLWTARMLAPETSSEEPSFMTTPRLTVESAVKMADYETTITGVSVESTAREGL